MSTQDEPRTEAGRALLADLREQRVATVDDAARILAIEAEAAADADIRDDIHQAATGGPDFTLARPPAGDAGLREALEQVREKTRLRLHNTCKWSRKGMTDHARDLNAPCNSMARWIADDFHAALSAPEGHRQGCARYYRPNDETAPCECDSLTRDEPSRAWIDRLIGDEARGTEDTPSLDVDRLARAMATAEGDFVGKGSLWTDKAQRIAAEYQRLTAKQNK